ncbi:hypothetical protein Tco_0551614 [Tanacetum coccineum]
MDRDQLFRKRDDDKLYTFKEGDFNRLRIQDIEDMLLLLVQGKLTNLTVEERLAFNVSLRMFTRSIVIQRRVEDLQLGVESYQKKLNLTNLDTYRSNLKQKEAYLEYSNPRVTHWFTLIVLSALRHSGDESNANVLERFYTSAGNHVKEILLKLNLHNHRSILMDSKVTPTKHRRMTKPYLSPRFIANCFNAIYLKMEVKVPDSS